MEPNIDHMLEHLSLLYDWTQTQYQNALFEVRCIDPKDRYAKSPNERFICTPEGYEQAIRFGIRHNDRGYNIYVTVNPLKPGTDHAAKDDDVEIAIYHFADADGLEEAERLAVEGSEGFKPTFSTLTGTIPKPRHHIYWRQSEPVIDMVAWHDTQAGLAQRLGSDESVKNPSRVDRLAGTISYPPSIKQERGYVTEVTSLNPTINGEVCSQSFAASFPYSQPAITMPPPVRRSPGADTSGNVPIEVVKAAFDAIPVLYGKGNRATWLDISMCAKAANPSCFPEFDEWQRRSDRYDRADSRSWPLGKEPRSDCYLGLFAHAKAGDQRWWARDADVYEWWVQQQAKRAASEHPTFGDGDPHGTRETREETCEAHEETHMPPESTFFGVRLRDLDLNPSPREFVYGKSLIRGMLSVFGGPGGAGKTSIVLTKMISLIIGKPLLALEPDDCEHRIYEPNGTCMYYSLEDPMDDLVRRVNGILAYYNIPHRAVWDNLILQSGRDLPLIVARQNDKGRLVREPIAPIVNYLARNNVVVLGIDPYANSFDGGDGAESSSDLQKIVIDQWRRAAHYANLAGWLVHHFKKGGLAGDADAFRGSSVMQNAARCMESLTTMTIEDAEKLGIDLYERRSYLRLENCKVNLSAAPLDGEWYRIVGQPLGNRTDKYPDGDVVGVPVRWKPQPIALAWSQVATALNVIDAGCEGGKEFYSSRPQASRKASEVIKSCCMRMTHAQAVAIMEEWLKLGVLVRDTYTSQNRHRTERLKVDPQAKERLRQQIEGA